MHKSEAHEPRIPALIRKLMGNTDMRNLLISSGRSASWVTFRIVIIGIIGLASNLILVRLLTPEAFGLIAMANSLSAAMILMSDIGLKGSVVHHPKAEDPAFLATVFLTRIIRGVIVAAIITICGFLLFYYKSALPSESIYAHPLAPAFVYAIAFQILISEFQSPNMYLAERQLKFARVSLLLIGSKLIVVPIMIVAALMGAGPWSLMIGLIVGTVLQTVLSHLVVEGPKVWPGYDKQNFSDVIGFGKWVMVSSIATIVIAQGDRFIFGALMTDELFSLYSVALVWIGLAMSVTSGLVRTIGMPALSEAYRSGPDALRPTYRRLRLFCDLGVMSLFLGIVLFHGPLFDLIYPPTFEPAQEFIPYAALLLLPIPLNLLATVNLATGDSRSFAGLAWVQAVVVVIAVPWAFHSFGPYLGVAAFSLSRLAIAPLAYLVTRRHMPLSWSSELPLLVFVVGAVAALALFGG